MAAKILRIVHNEEFLSSGAPNPDFKPGEPLLWTEALFKDETAPDGKPKPEWSRDIDIYHRFPSHGEADRRAEELRAAGISCFARTLPADMPQHPPIEQLTLAPSPLAKPKKAKPEPPRIPPENVRLPYRDD